MLWENNQLLRGKHTTLLINIFMYHTASVYTVSIFIKRIATHQVPFHATDTLSIYHLFLEQ